MPDGPPHERHVVFDLLDLLDRLNRKERFFLVGEALGNTGFQPSPEYIGKVAAATGVEFPPPHDIHCFMDFHLDWIYAALLMHRTRSTGPFPSPEFTSGELDGVPRNVNANQEDVDLLLAFRSGDVYHLVMIEAKAESSWLVKQLASKGRRLRRIFGETGYENFPDVIPHMVLTSHTRPIKVDWAPVLPPWALGDAIAPSWFKLVSPPTQRILIHRCDELGNPADSGVHWVANGLTI